MQTEREVRRLKELFSHYDEDATQNQWDETNPGNRAIMLEWTQVLWSMMDSYGFLPLAERRILEVGCGNGKVLARFAEKGADPKLLYGIDLVPERIMQAKQQHPGFQFEVGNAEQLEFEDGAFDLVLVFTVFTSILDGEMAQNVAREVSRVLKLGGALVWYDFRYDNPRNPEVRGMTKKDIQKLFPNFKLRLRTVTLLPPLARRLGRMTKLLYPALVQLPLLRTHYIGLLVKP